MSSPLARTLSTPHNGRQVQRRPLPPQLHVDGAVQLRPKKSSYGDLSRARSRSSLPLIPSNQRHISSWPSLHGLPTSNSSQSRRRKTGLKLDECRPALADVNSALFYLGLGERGVPEGREDSASFTSSHEDLKLVFDPNFKPLASSSTIFRHSQESLRLPEFVRERLVKRFRVHVPLPSAVKLPLCLVVEQTLSEDNRIVDQSDVSPVYLNWNSESEPVDLNITNEDITVGDETFPWEELESVVVSYDSGIIELNSTSIYVPNRTSCLHLCSRIAFRLRKLTGAVKQKESSLFLASCAFFSVSPNSASTFSSWRRNLSLRCAWKPLKARAGEKWRRGFVELTENEVFISESLDRTPTMVLALPRRPADLRLVDVDAKVFEELPDYLTSPGRRVLRIGVEVFLAVDKPETLMEVIQESCAKRRKLDELLVSKTVEERVKIRLKRQGLEVDFSTSKFCLDYVDIAMVNVHVAPTNFCVVVLKSSGGTDIPALILRFPGVLERNAFLRRLCDSTTFSEYSGVAISAISEETIPTASRFFAQT